MGYGDFKAFGLISQIPFDEVKIGMGMVVKVNELPGDNLNYRFEKPRQTTSVIKTSVLPGQRCRDR